MNAHAFIGPKKWSIIPGEIEAERNVEPVGRGSGGYTEFHSCADESVFLMMRGMPVTFVLRMQFDVDPKYSRRRQSIIAQKQRITIAVPRRMLRSLSLLNPPQLG